MISDIFQTVVFLHFTTGVNIDFYEYIKKLFMDLPNLDFHQSNDVLEEYMPWSKNIQEACSNKEIAGYSRKNRMVYGYS